VAEPPPVKKTRKRRVRKLAPKAKPTGPKDPYLRKPDRKNRKPFGTRTTKWNAPPDDGYHYRVFNDNWHKDPLRIENAIDAGYEVVDGIRRLPVGTNENGSPVTGILMRIPKEMYEEDQEPKREERRRVKAQIERGSFQEKPEDHRYVPPGGIQIDDQFHQ
jgi:hypothetical protein